MNYIGKDFPVSDCREKAAGSAKYAGDMELPNMLYAAMVFSPYPNCLVKSIDTTKALEVEGVEKIFHCFNTPETTFNRFRTFYKQKVYNQERIFNEHLRFVGDRVAAVAASSPEAARQAAELIQIEYEQLPYSLDIATTKAGKIDDIFPDGAVYPIPTVEIGKAESIPQDTVETITQTNLGRIAHVTMETHACLADYDQYSGNLTIWSPNQSVFSIRTVIGDLLNIPYHKIRVIKTTMGGSFGCKQEWITEPVAAYMAMATGRPIKLVYNRKAEFASTVSRSPMQASVKTYISLQGEIKGLTVDADIDAGAYVGNSYDYALAMAYKYTRNYRIPYLQYNARAIITNTPVSGAFRGWTSPEATIMLEHNLDMAAKKLNMDPVDLRLKNAYTEGDVDNKINVPLENTQIIRALKEGRKIFGWDEKQAAYSNQKGRYRRGIGVACGGHVSGYFPRKQDFATAILSVNEDGTLIAHVTIHDHGCGTVTCFKMMAAEALGIDINDILLSEADTAHTPFDMGCFSSRTTYVVGQGLLQACENLIQEILAATAAIHKVSISELSYDQGIIYHQGRRLATFKEVGRDSILLLQKQLCAKGEYINNTNPGVHGVHFAEVEVDTYTGFINVIDYLAVHDIGRAINKGICIAQIQGAITMGIGAAIREELAVNQRGIPKTSLKDYHLMTCCDLPEIKVHLIEEPCANGPFGAKSIGEVCHVPVSAAIISAVNNALNSEICTIPMTPDFILAYLAQKESE